VRSITKSEFEQIKNQTLTNINHPVYDPGKVAISPECIYFYYVTLTALKRPVVCVYYYDHKRPFGAGELVESIKALARNARLNEDVPPKCGTTFECINWQRKSYFVMMLDHDDIFLMPDNAIMFDVAGGHTPNHTFFDGDDINIEVQNISGDMDLVPALCCINYMSRNEAGNDLGPEERQHFIYKIYTKSRTRPDFIGQDVIDPGGTNLGPPVPPP
jgi:hypothetical protein